MGLGISTLFGSGRSDRAGWTRRECAMWWLAMCPLDRWLFGMRMGCGILVLCRCDRLRPSESLDGIRDLLGRGVARLSSDILE